MLTLFVVTGMAAAVLLAGFLVHEVRDARRTATAPGTRGGTGRWRYESTVAK
jgi:hypothetical protein